MTANNKFCMMHTEINEFYRNVDKGRSPGVTGLYAWLDALDAPMIGPKDFRPGDYDIILINLCKATLPYVNYVRDNDRDATIITFLDYDMEMLPQYGGFAPYADAMSNADFAVCSSESQIHGMQHICKKQLHLIPHPADVAGLKKMRKKKSERSGIVIMPHVKYGQDPDLTTLGCISSKLKKHIYYQSSDPKRVQSALADRRFDFCLATQRRAVYYPHLNNRLIGLDTHCDLAYGRFQVDLAALGIPCVGPGGGRGGSLAGDVESQKILFPKLAVDTRSSYSQMDVLINKLETDDELYDNVVEYATEMVEMYSHESCRKTLLKMMEGDSKLGVPDGKEVEA